MSAVRRDLVTVGKLALALTVALGIQQGLLYAALVIPWRWAAVAVLVVDLLWSVLLLTVCTYLAWSTWHSLRASTTPDHLPDNDESRGHESVR
jgi:hypothetical protein